IAGQTERYVAHQVALIASGERNTGMSAVMVPFVKDLTAQDMRDLGAYFATQKSAAGVADDAVISEGPYQGMKFYEAGEKLYRGGD
ncbi:MAG: cytochrome c4, partial [Xanthomonas perforans]|nr:cytochrome c4 [Xanthomonas perforans]